MISVLVKFTNQSKSIFDECIVIKYESIIEFSGDDKRPFTTISTSQKDYYICLNYLIILSEIESGLKKAKCHKWPFIIIDLTRLQAERLKLIQKEFKVLREETFNKASNE
tara:strand:+ start:330 stop:659 length:330 start_codon:yes stop_codon:yes gene_type:complete